MIPPYSRQRTGEDIPGCEASYPRLSLYQAGVRHIPARWHPRPGSWQGRGGSTGARREARALLRFRDYRQRHGLPFGKNG